MIDGPTASVICTTLFTVFGTIIVAMIKFIPSRQGAGRAAIAETEEKCHRRMAQMETRVAVVENNVNNWSRAFEDLRREIHEMRKELQSVVSGRAPPH